MTLARLLTSDNTVNRLPVAAILGLGFTQIIGYGTLYYAFSILAPAMAQDFSLSVEWLFGALSVAFLAGGLLSPWLGRSIDRFGAGQIMLTGSILAAMILAASSASSEPLVFAITLVAAGVIANFVQYGAAFSLLVQINAVVAPRSITYLTLIAGFTSTIFWPVTAALQHYLSWREIYLVFAALHLLVCAPVHLLLARSVTATLRKRDGRSDIVSVDGLLPEALRKQGLLLLIAGVSLQSLAVSAILVHMVPLLGALGLGASAVFIGGFLGPSQVASRFIMMLAGRNVTPVTLAILSVALMTGSLFLLTVGTPSIVKTILFACLFGFGNGIFSIIYGTLPLFLFGSRGYGELQGKITAARLSCASAAPFLFALAIQLFGPNWSLDCLALIGVMAILAFLGIRRLHLR